jgi:hypothetical protein
MAIQVFPYGRGMKRFAFLLIACIGLGSPANATMACATLEQRSTASDPRKTKAIEDFSAANYGSRAIKAGKLAEQFYIARLEQPECRVSVCWYHLLQFNPQGLQEKFAFRATNAIWIVLSPTEFYLEEFKDHYSIVAVRTQDRAYLAFHLPRGSGPMLVEAWPADAKLPRCSETAK